MNNVEKRLSMTIMIQSLTSKPKTLLLQKNCSQLCNIRDGSPTPHYLKEKKEVQMKMALLNLASTASPQDHITHLFNKNSSAAERVLHLLYSTHYSTKCTANMNGTE